MGKGLGRFISIRLLLAILGAGALSGLASIGVGLVIFETMVDSTIEDEFQEAENRIAIFDTVLSRAERESERRSWSALLELAKRYPTLAAARAASEAELTFAAAELGVSEVYFIDAGGTIRASSHGPDLGLNLFLFGDMLRTRIGGLLGTGRFATDRMSLSTLTSEVLNYQYYGPAGADYVVEVSSRLDDIIALSYPGYDLASLVRLLSNADGLTERAFVRPTDLAWGRSPPYRSFLTNEIVPRALEPVLMEAALDGKQASSVDGTLTTMVRVVSLTESGLDFRDELFVVLRADRSFLALFALYAAVAAASLIGVGTVAFYAMALRAFGRRVTSRLERLEEAMGAVALGAHERNLDDAFGDEISSIARSAEAMVRQIRERNDRLQTALAANEALVHELDHRVNNNLQLAMSLASMQSRAATSEAVEAALERMRGRLAVVAMIQDQALRRPLVDMGQLLSSLGADIAAGYRPRAERVELAVRANGIRLVPGRAVDVCFIAAELIDNAYRHAFTERGGALEITLAEGDETLSLTVSDDGSGGARRVGVGLELCAALAQQLGGTISWDGPSPGRRGTSAELRVPLDRR